MEKCLCVGFEAQEATDHRSIGGRWYYPQLFFQCHTYRVTGGYGNGY